MRRLSGWLAVGLLCSSCLLNASNPQRAQTGEVQITQSDGRFGGRLVMGQRAEPKTLNPVLAADAPSREVIGCMMADLIHINRYTQKTEPALAKSWTESKDGRIFTLKLRKGLRFSDGQPFNADDVVFSFKVYLDEKLNSPQRDLLIVGGKPIQVEKIDDYTVRFTLAAPYAAAERLFDSVAMLPRHLLQQSYETGGFGQAWGLNAAPSSIAGLGAFRLKEYAPGQRIVLERNPYYWKIDRNKKRLPYVDELAFLFVGSEDAQVLRFQSGETDAISRVSAENFSLLERDREKRGYQLVNLGPSLEYNFLVFNQNDVNPQNLGAIAQKQEWFRDKNFRQAVSAAIDREGIVRLVYGRRGTPLWGNVSPSNKQWVDPKLASPRKDLNHARELLKTSGFSWRADGKLQDKRGQLVEFSIITSSSNAQRTKMATIVQDDLSQLGMTVHVAPMEFRALLDRMFQSFDYEVGLMGLGGGDADPNSEMNVWRSNGSAHLWHLGESKPATPWEAQLDQLMNSQLTALKYSERKKLYDRAQEIIADNAPFVFLATPNILIAAKPDIGNLKPAVLEPFVLWNVEELYRQNGAGTTRAGR